MCLTECTSVPSVDNSKTTVNGSASVTEVAHGTQIDYLCENGFFPTTTQSVFCGSIIPGQVDVSNITCNKIGIVFNDLLMLIMKSIFIMSSFVLFYPIPCF